MSESKKTDGSKPEAAYLQFIGILAKAVAAQLKREDRERREKTADASPSETTADQPDDR